MYQKPGHLLPFPGLGSLQETFSEAELNKTPHSLRPCRMQTSSQLDNPFQLLLNQQRTAGGKAGWKGETALYTLCNKVWF